MSDIKLKPCPFCGGEVKLLPPEHSFLGMSSIECSTCGYRVERPNTNALIEWWNRRDGAE